MTENTLHGTMKIHSRFLRKKRHLTEYYSSMRNTILVLFTMSLCSMLFAQDAAKERIEPALGKPSLSITEVFKGERFPNIVVTKKGTLLATWGKQHVQAKRSTDGGETWGEAISIVKGHIHGGGTTVDEMTGDILVFAEEGVHPPSKIAMFRSKDDGKHWQQEDITIKKDSRGGSPSMSMNEHGITLRHGEQKGRLIRPSRDYGKGNMPMSIWPTHYTNAIYSDDRGKTWRTSEPFPEFGTGEACLVELSDGRIYYNTRRHWAPEGKNAKRRWHAWSRDGGVTWVKVGICEILPDGTQGGSPSGQRGQTYGLMGGLVRLPIEGRDVLVFSNIISDGDTRARNNGHVWVSFDGGETWPLKRQVDPGRFAYSSMATGRPGTASEGWIYVHYESKGGSRVARFNLSWLLQGEATGDGTMPELKDLSPE